MPVSLQSCKTLLWRRLSVIIETMKRSSSYPDDANPLRQLPSVHRVLALPAVTELASRLPATVVAAAVRAVLAAARDTLASADGASVPRVPSTDELCERVVAEALQRAAPSLQRAVNATGIVLHTGLGRARLADAARDALLDVASGHSLVEIDRGTGQRGSRRDHVRGLLCELTGAEDATVVNNCAGAVFLAVTALAAGREVIISRGELVEIGGAFRMPDIIRASGATLVEVGTTNRTRLSDYENAITERTGLILRCHPSNFAIIGFTEETSTTELARLGRERGIPVMDDQGSGGLLNVLARQTTLRDSVAASGDLITASGDKLLGGPQAGLILGDKQYVGLIVRHPLARALRVDKFTLAALEATLRLYREPDRAMQAIPTLRYLARQLPELRRLAQRLARGLRAALPPDRFAVTLLPERSQVGGGSLPGEDLPTVCVRLCPLTGDPPAERVAASLRAHTPPVFGRIKDGAVLFDPRTLEAEEVTVIVAAARTLVAPKNTQTNIQTDGQALESFAAKP
jgi:L-seryl-tRNA(Ser) seleniumtransferase